MIEFMGRLFKSTIISGVLKVTSNVWPSFLNVESFRHFEEKRLYGLRQSTYLLDICLRAVTTGSPRPRLPIWESFLVIKL